MSESLDTQPAPAIERLRTEVERVAGSEHTSMGLTVVGPDGAPHGCTTWFAPTEDLSLLWLSAPSREHSELIEACFQAGRKALASCQIREEGQVKSDPRCHGVDGDGVAQRLTNPTEIKSALDRMSKYRTFTPEELEKYLGGPHGKIPTHAVYRFDPWRWTVFDGRLGADSAERLVRIPVRIGWPPEIV